MVWNSSFHTGCVPNSVLREYDAVSLGSFPDIQLQGLMGTEWADCLQDSEEDGIASHPFPIMLEGLFLNTTLSVFSLMTGEL